MKFSDRTLTVLKNFVNINPGIVFKPGQVVRTATPEMDVLALATVDEKIDKKFAIADLSQFLSALSSFQNPDIVLKDKYLILTNGGRKLQFVYGEELFIKTPPDKELVMPDVITTFKLLEIDLNGLNRVASFMRFPELAIVGEGENVILRGLDVKNPTNHLYNHKLPDVTNPKHFAAVFASSKFNLLMPGDYNVTVTKGVVKFEGPVVTYWMAPQDRYSKYD